MQFCVYVITISSKTFTFLVNCLQFSLNINKQQAFSSREKHTSDYGFEEMSRS